MPERCSSGSQRTSSPDTRGGRADLDFERKPAKVLIDMSQSADLVVVGHAPRGLRRHAAGLGEPARRRARSLPGGRPAREVAGRSRPRTASPSTIKNHPCHTARYLRLEKGAMDGAEAQRRAGAGTPAGHAGGHPALMWASGVPETRYVESEDGYVAYQVFGQGPSDLLFIGNWASNVEVMWEHPSMARYLERLGNFARVICFDKRGAGLSDPVALGAMPTLEHWMDDARIVLDAASSEKAALIGDAEGGPMAMMFAATYPQRTRALVLVNTFAKMLRVADYSIGMPEEAAEQFLQIWERAWGTGIVLELSAPSVADDPQRALGLVESCTLGAARGIHPDYRWVLQLDVRPVLPEHPGRNLNPATAPRTVNYRAPMGRYLAEHIPGAKYVDLPELTVSPLRERRVRLDEIEEFSTGARPAPAGSPPGHRAVHRHRGLDRSGRQSWRPALARPQGNP